MSDYLSKLDLDCIGLAVARVAHAAFLEDMGEQAFMALNVDALVAFGDRNGISRQDMNLAWEALQRRHEERQEQREARLDWRRAKR